MKIRILSWNVRGANDRDKRRIIKSVIKSQRVDVVCLQETKIKEMSTGLVRSLGVGRNIEWRAVNSRGAAGGILVFWDNRVVELVGWEQGVFSISCRFKNCVDGVVWVFTGCMGGFQRSVAERWSYSFYEEILRSGRGSGAQGLSLRGGPFTWRGGLNNRVQSRLDRFLVTDNWDNMFNGAVQGILPRPVSDHFPILLEGGGLKRGPSPFRVKLLKQVEYWDEKEKYDVLNMEDCEARNGAREAYKSWVIKEEIFWRQKSRELWLKEGDNNTRFFHRMANAHCRRNWLAVPGEEGWRPSVDGISFMRLDISEAEGLEIPFVEEEVLAALTDLGKDKAPGPDGFTMAFWLYGWDVVKFEIMGFFREFHERGRFVKSLNATFLVLVPKKGGAEDLKDFRPISLVGSLYKLLAKVLANRIKKVMGKVISEPQNAFVEVLVDCVKANGIWERWIMWIEWCISTVRYSVLINGSPSGFFQSSRGLRQGTPIPLPVRDSYGGLKVNLEKSELIPVGRVTDIEDLALELGCKVGGLPSRKVRMRLEKIQRDFLWGGGALEQRPHLVRWNLVCLEKKKGGLGVRNLALMNKALLGKWNWRFATEREVLWKKVISHKYGVEEGGWCTRAERGRHGVGLWKAIRKEWLGMYSSLAFRVGNGRRVRFWKDKWCGDEPLYESFPLFLPFLRLKTRGFRKCGTQMGAKVNEDKMVWTTSKSGVFSVKSLYSILEPGGSAMFPYVGIWKAMCRQRCFLCLAEAETVDHLLLHCVMTRTLWNLLFSLFGVEWVLSGTVKDTLLGWHGAFVGKIRKKAWQMAPLCIFWSVWKERNSLAFGNEVLSIQRGFARSFAVLGSVEGLLLYTLCIPRGH
ncbi:putative ribonuclease H protein [Vitis vinifera]|uniref:Putative ribonuclease H protein n=1 Tax=Vitis vinifera TaxID=29760 RepID=A0A438CS86_VITVI|nr:putative ribonuclease H protein [Vitis vinifera]